MRPRRQRYAPSRYIKVVDPEEQEEAVASQALCSGDLSTRDAPLCIARTDCGLGGLAEGDQRDRAAQKVFAERDPENLAAISIRSTRPPVITVIGASPVGARLKCHSSRLEMTLPCGLSSQPRFGKGERQDFRRIGRRPDLDP